jgi:hypothetical protein
VYPTTFTQFVGTISGLPSRTLGRFAFRYYVTNGGPSGANSDIISIDDVQFPLAPTAAGVSVSGRVLTPAGRGLAGATVVLTSPSGERWTTSTSTFGRFSFDDVEVGQTYVVSVISRRFSFDPYVVNVSDNVDNLVLIAQ